MNIRERLRNTHSLSANERTIAEYLLNQTTEAVGMDYHQLAERCHVSVSCVFGCAENWRSKALTN